MRTVQNKNFTFSDEWITGIKKRFPNDRLLTIGDVWFFYLDDCYICQHYFDFNIDKNFFEMLKGELNRGSTFRFKYIDERLLGSIKEWCNHNMVSLNILDEWEAPKLLIENYNVDDYLYFKCGRQTRKNFKKYKSSIEKYKYVTSTEQTVEKLWDDVLYIDSHCWKARDRSDMKSLNREDIQYESFLKQKNNESLLTVVYDKNEPLAYSLMFWDRSTKQWYAVKWGASDNGRKKYVGFFCLYNSLENIEKLDGKINLDFWGRRSSTYDALKNSSVKRYHIALEAINSDIKSS